MTLEILSSISDSVPGICISLISECKLVSHALKRLIKGSSSSNNSPSVGSSLAGSSVICVSNSWKLGVIWAIVEMLSPWMNLEGNGWSLYLFTFVLGDLSVNTCGII
jgi:hypothetical protein